MLKYVCCSYYNNLKYYLYPKVTTTLNPNFTLIQLNIKSNTLTIYYIQYMYKNYYLVLGNFKIRKSKTF